MTLEEFFGSIDYSTFERLFFELTVSVKFTPEVSLGAPKKMPSGAYDTLMLGYDEETAIKDGELMVDFHNEFAFGRFYRKNTFEELVLPNKKNVYTKEDIKEYTVYQAIV